MASIADPPVPVHLDLWDVTLAKLPSNDQQALRSGLGIPVTIEDVRASISEARGKADKKWTIKGQRGDVNLRVHFDKVVHWVQEFVAIGDTIVTYDPGHAALPWAAMRFLLQILVNNSERAAGFINGLDELAFYIYFCTKVERRFLRDETYEEKLELENRITDLYSTILQFMLKARQYFETSPAIRLAAGLHKSTDGITKKLSLAESQFQKILIVSTFINTQLQTITRDAIEHLSKSHAESMTSLKSQLEDLLRLQRGKFTDSEITLHGVRELVVSRKPRTLSSLVRAIRLIIRLRKAVAFIEGEEYKQYDRTAILRWLSTIPYQDHQTAARKEVQEGTGGWFLQDDVYRAWKASDETSLLWLRGPPGCGKSKLMSLAIEEALNGGTGSSDAGVFYFHCSSNPAEPERADFESIIRCLVKQGSSGGTPSEPRMIPRYVVRAFKVAEVNGFASRYLSGEDCCAIMSKYAIDHRRMIIFLDALDECESEQREKIMDALSLVVESSGDALVKFLVSSRDDVSLDMLPKHKQFQIHVEEDCNQQDINGYVKAQLSQLIQQKKIRILGSKGVPKGLQAKIIDRLSQGAQGMFRWVSIQLDYLCTLKTKRDIENRLGKLPPKLIDMYGELFRRRTQPYGPEQRRILDVALSSLLLPIRPGAMVFARMLFANEGDESIDEDDSSSGNESSDEDDSSSGNESSDEDDSSSGDEFSDEDDSSGGSDAERPATEPVNRTRAVQWPETVTELCFNLVVFDSTSRVFRFAHTSVQDYLLKHENGYYASEKRNSARVAEHCISLLLDLPDHIHENDQIFYQSESQQVQTNRKSRPGVGGPTDISFWYVQPSPANSRTRLERAIAWVQDNWGFFVSCSREYREELPLMDLEVRLQQKLVLQPWESVNPRIFFSACQFGLRFFVDTWTKAHTHLINVRFLPAADKKNKKLLGTGLQYACIGGDSGIVERLIDGGAVIDYYSRGTPKTNALCIALQQRNTTITKLLLDRGASPSLALDADVSFPLHSIISDGHEDALSLAQILLEHGADADLVDDQGMTAIALAVEKEDLEVVRLMLKKNAKTTLRLTTHGGTNILALATRIRTTPQKSLKMAELMLEHGMDVEFPTAARETPLWWAAKNGNLDVARLLLDHGASIDSQDVLGRTALAAAIASLPTNSEVRVQIPKPPVKLLGSIAEVQKHGDVARLLISSGANTNICARSGWGPLHHAAMNGSSEIIELLLSHSANPNLTVEDGSTALRIAIYKGYKKIVELLLTYNADLHARDKQGWTALHYAARYGHESTTKLLLTYNADVKALGPYGYTALDLAAMEGHTDIVALLVDAGSKLSAIDVNGYTAVHRAALGGHDKTVESLLALVADPNILTLHGNNALSNAACSSKPEVCELLLPTTTEVNSQDGDGDTALSNAIQSSQPPYIIELLLGAGAQIVPQKPGPHCSFLDHTERIEGYGSDALLKAWNKKDLDLLQTMLRFAARRDPSGEYATALVLWEKKDKEEFAAWIEARRANAPENRPEIVAFREKIKRRWTEIVQQNKQRLAMELGLDPPGKE